MRNHRQPFYCGDARLSTPHVVVACTSMMQDGIECRPWTCSPWPTGCRPWSRRALPPVQCPAPRVAARMPPPAFESIMLGAALPALAGAAGQSRTPWTTLSRLRRPTAGLTLTLSSCKVDLAAGACRWARGWQGRRGGWRRAVECSAAACEWMVAAAGNAPARRPCGNLTHNSPPPSQCPQPP